MAEKNNETVEVKEGLVTRVGKWIDRKVANRKPIPKGVKIASAIAGTLGAGAAAYFAYTHLTGGGAEALSEGAEAVKELAENATDGFAE